jgi:hypothetical protein
MRHCLFSACMLDVTNPRLAAFAPPHVVLQPFLAVCHHSFPRNINRFVNTTVMAVETSQMLMNGPPGPTRTKSEDA